MANSKDFIEAKKLIYKDKYKVTNVKASMEQVSGKQKHSARIDFEKGTDTKYIESTSDDFVILAWHIKKSFDKEGKSRLIEIKDTNRYYSNLEILFGKGNFDNKKSMGEAIKKIQAGKSGIPSSFRLDDAIDNVTKNKINKEEIDVMLKNYFEILAREILILNSLNQNFEKIQNNSKNKQRVLDFFREAEKVFQQNLFNHPPMKALEDYNKFKTVDLSHLIKIAVETEEYRKKKGQFFSNNGKDGIDPKIGVNIILEDYKKYFEICKKLLRNLAQIISYNTTGQSISTEKDVFEILAQNGYNKLFASIDKDIRNSDAHVSFEYIGKGKVNLLDTRTSKTKIIKTLTLNDLLEKTDKIRELHFALIFATINWGELLLFRCLDSPEFKVLLVENS